MSSKLEQAMRQLPPDKLRQLEQFAQKLIDDSDQASAPPSHLQLDWVGKAADAYPEHQSGVDAAHAALEMMRRALERETIS